MPGTRQIPQGFALPTQPGMQARDAMLKLAEIFGDTELFQFLGLMHGHDSPVGEVRAIMAAHHVLAELKFQPGLTYHQARLVVGKEFGYSGNGLSNWNKIADRGRDMFKANGQWNVDK